jgi:hypothetical protein
MTVLKPRMCVRTWNTRGRTSCGVPLSTSRREPLERKLQHRHDGRAPVVRQHWSGSERMD